MVCEDVPVSQCRDVARTVCLPVPVLVEEEILDTVCRDVVTTQCQTLERTQCNDTSQPTELLHYCIFK